MLGGAIKDPPAIYLKKLAEANDVKALLNDHRVLHAWMQELQSASPRTVLGNGWTPVLIKAAHDAVVERIKALKPDFDHASPITGAEVKISEPLMLIPNYVSQVGSSLDGKPDADIDIVVRDDGPKNESLEVRLAKALGDKLHFNYNPQGPHDTDFKPLYHLVLIPVDLWTKISSGLAPSAVALHVYRDALGGALKWGEMKKRIMIGAGILMKTARNISVLEAAKAGEEMALKVLTDEPLLYFSPSARIDAASFINLILEEALKIYASLMVPITDFEEYSRGLRMIFDQVDEWKKTDPFKNKEEALDAARELAGKVVKEVRGKTTE